MNKHQQLIHAYKVLSIVILFVFAASLHAQRYETGDIVENFSLTDRATNKPVSLHDFEGKIVFLEWFAYWCPYCQAAAAQTESGIVNHYENTQGNPDGIPVIHVAINLESTGADLIQKFIDKYHLNLVLNDYDRGLANRFQRGGQPIFAIINGVKNASTHQQWELIYSRLGYGDTQHPISAFRAAIDSVKMGSPTVAPVITQQPQAARIATGTSHTLSVQASGSDLAYQWKKDNSPLSGQTSPQLQLSDASLADSGSYSVDISNSAGLVSSAEAVLHVVQSLSDFLENAGLTNENLAPDADPDRDGFPNALEYLAQSNPNAATDVPNATLEFTLENNVPALRIQFESSPETIGYDLAALFWSYPSSAGNAIHTLSLGQSSEVIEPIPATATTFLGRLQATPSL